MNRYMHLIDKIRSLLPNRSKPKIGIALGGGGARGFAHLGVIKAIKEQGIEFDMISGSSAGSIAGAFIAAGIDPVDTCDILKEKNMFGYSKFRLPTGGLFGLNGLSDLIKEKIPFENIEDLPIPFSATVTNLNTGRAEYFSNGSIAQAVTASSSIPFIFKPLEINGKKYADGGIIDNLPVKPLEHHCQKIIAVSISPISETQDLDSLTKIVGRAFQLSINAQNHQIKDKCDIYIEPKGIRKYDIFSIGQAEELFEKGYQSLAKRDLKKELGLAHN